MSVKAQPPGGSVPDRLRTASLAVIAACLVTTPAWAQQPPANSQVQPQPHAQPQIETPPPQDADIADAPAPAATPEAEAQAAPAPAPAPGGAIEPPAEPTAQDIVVTGSRITTSGFTAPTPTTVIDAAAIAANAQPNIFTTIAQLPSLQGSTGTSTGTFSTSSGQQGLSSFSLRGVGAIRTLTLLDGQRVVGANVTGVPDISLFPQLLVKRVDVVNGGASASYGSDAVGGVVNFITDTRFKGVKGNVQGGITTYGDNEQVLVQLAAGTSFLENRLHKTGCTSSRVPNSRAKRGLAAGRIWGSAWRADATGSASRRSSTATS